MIFLKITTTDDETIMVNPAHVLYICRATRNNCAQISYNSGGDSTHRTYIKAINIVDSEDSDFFDQICAEPEKEPQTFFQE